MRGRTVLRSHEGDDSFQSHNGPQPQQGQELAPQQQAMPRLQQQLPQQPRQQQQEQPQQQQPAAPGQAGQGTRVQLTPDLAARLIASAAAAGRPAASLTPQDVAIITCAWLPLLPPTMGDCNRLLSARMRAALPGDPIGFDLIKQDGKDFISGAIPAAEFADRFFSIFAATPGDIKHELFMQMALLVPQPNKRLELLQHAAQPWLLPNGPLTIDSITAALAAQAQQQQQQQQQQELAPMPAAAQAKGDEGEDEYVDDEDEYEGEDQYEDEDEDEDEYEDEFEDEYEAVDEGEGEADAGGRPPAAVDLTAAEDLRELKGWIPVDRSRLQALAVGLSVPSSSELAAAAAAKRPRGQRQALQGVELDTGIHVNSGGSRPAKKSAGKKARETAAAASVDESEASAANTAIVWFRQDLRIHDNPALVEAAKWAQKRGGSVVCVYVHSPEEDGDAIGAGSSWRPGPASLLWAQCALQSLSADLVARYGAGAGIVFKQGPYVEALTQVAGVVNAGAVFFNNRYEPAMQQTDARVVSQLAAAGISTQGFAGLLLQEPWDVKLNLSKWHGHFGTLMPFFRAWSTVRAPDRPLPEPQQLPVAKRSVAPEVGGLPLTALGLYKPPRRKHHHTDAATAAAAAHQLHPGSSSSGSVQDPDVQQLQQPVLQSHPLAATSPSSAVRVATTTPQADADVIDWGATIRSSWDISERGALQLLGTFLSSSSGLSAYESARSYADGRSVSKLSPYLHWGQLSVRLMWQRMKVAKAQEVSKTFYRRLIWRDLAYWQLYHWPRMATHPIRPGYSSMRWLSGPQADAALKAWQTGQTGFPLVDAGMRELWATGWMQQSVRMVAAAFLTEYLSLPWTAGAAWFHDTLVDADLAINSMMWQNAGKSGLDQWNFTLLPTSKSQDPTGTYIKRWVPELSRLSPAHLHAPWLAPPADLAAAGVFLGRTYPHRIVTSELSELRAANVAAIRAARAAAIECGELRADSRGYDMITVPEGSTLKHDGGDVVLFTKPEYRQLHGPIPVTPVAAGSAPVDEGEADEVEGAAAGAPGSWGGRQKVKKQKTSSSGGGGGKGQRRPVRGRGRQPQQQTLDDIVGRLGAAR